MTAPARLGSVARATLDTIAGAFAARLFGPDDVLVAHDVGSPTATVAVVPRKRARALARTAHAKRIARRLSERAPVGHVFLVSFDVAGGVAIALAELEPRTNAVGGAA